MKEHQSVYDWALDRASHYATNETYAEMSPEDQQHLVDEILANPYVYQNIVPVNVENTPASIDPDGGLVTNVAFSYKDPDAGAAAMIVVYKGTGGPMEWRDNGVGGYYDTIDTPQQQAALDFFERATAGYEGDIYVTGHSKGGNKAQYVAVVADDPRIQSVTSFDGQGFNAAFLHKYADQIARNAGKITSVANQLDYVNGLFTQIAGQTIYIESATTSPAGFRQWHSPYSMFQENLDGTVSLGDQAPQAAAIKQVEGLLDFYQAYMPKEDFQYLCFALMSFMMGDEAG
ncbi:MAG: DUF2974 domain-containing protein, partial [Propionibacteriaceae bacterium]|nr:DUF2974 domain-containing protein [Propionibacteriaceae bacterium]